MSSSTEQPQPRQPGAESDAGASGSETPPNRLAADPKSRFFDATALERGVGVRFKGVERFDVEEYCVSERWVRVPAGKSRDRHGNPMTIKLQGDVEVFYREPA